MQSSKDGNNTLNPSLKDLEVLIGNWTIELSFPSNPTSIVKGETSIEWLEDGAFIIIHLGSRKAKTPFSICIIGRDNSTDEYSELYIDDRGVSRIYQMSFENNEWKLWRDSPNLSQRFVGKLTENDNIILAKWEKSTNGLNWEHDFDIKYIRKTVN